MTSSNPPYLTPSPSFSHGLALSPRGVSLPPSSLSRPPSFPAATRTLPPRSLVLPHERVLPTYILSPYLSSQPPASSSTNPLYSGNPLVCLPLFLSPSSSPFLLPFPAFRPYELSTGAIPMDKSGDGLLSTSCSTDQTRIPTNRNAGGLRYRHGALTGRRLHAKCGQTGTRREKYIDTL